MTETQNDTAHRYEELAGFVAGLVDKGTLRPGSRAPSLRRLSKDRRASLSTALKAYQLLEDRGILEARPRSGYYVARRPAASLEAPALSRPPGMPTSVAISATVLSLVEYASDPRLVPLGCAVPSPELLAAGQLDRFLARAARVKGLDYNIYTAPKGDAALRHEICRRALRWGQGWSPDDVVITCGCTEALTLALKAVARAGDTIAVESPTYFGLLHVLEALGLKVLELPTDAEKGVDLAVLEGALQRKSITACLFASSFNNPLGCTMPDTRKLELLRLLTRHGVPLIEDDVYGDIYFGGERPKPFGALDPAADTIYCSSFSKTIAPGYRIGWLAAGRRMQTILQHKVAATLATPALTQAALADLLSCGGYDSHLRRIRRVFAENIDRMTRAIERGFPAGTRVSRPAGGFVLWVELPPPADTRVMFAEAVKRGICFAPGDVFSVSDRYRHCLRLSCGYGWDRRIEAGVEAIGALAAERQRGN
ncbi:MAG TPA: PLP-dependent aminotransferase family protein [Stellaceae bacterium]|jgi:DNA-binding transcriptional MocR family regulator|nr:PLP-dependent aminotransferase family protein [Stellaceae bacterium]